MVQKVPMSLAGWLDVIPKVQPSNNNFGHILVVSNSGDVIKERWHVRKKQSKRGRDLSAVGVSFENIEMPKNLPGNNRQPYNFIKVKERISS